MYAEHASITILSEIIMWTVTGILSVALLWRTFEDEGWPGVLAFFPLINLIILGIIIVRIGWWSLRHTLIEIILITILTIASLYFMPVMVKSCPTLSAIIILMPPSIIGGFLVSRKLGCHAYNLYIPAATITFPFIVITGIFILLMIFAIKSLGAEGIRKILVETVPGIKEVDAETALSIFNMGLYIVVLIMITSVPAIFVYGIIGAWIGERIRLQFSHTPPNEVFMKIDNRVPPRPLVDISTSINSPLRSRARNMAKEPATTKRPAKMTIIDKLKA
jgi:hypothetical protein